MVKAEGPLPCPDTNANRVLGPHAEDRTRGNKHFFIQNKESVEILYKMAAFRGIGQKEAISDNKTEGPKSKTKSVDGLSNKANISFCLEIAYVGGFYC